MNIDQNNFWKKINQNQLSIGNIEADFGSFKSSPTNYKTALKQGFLTDIANTTINPRRLMRALIFLDLTNPATAGM